MVANSQRLMGDKKNWKAALMDYDFLTGLDDVEDLLICITEREQQMLLTLLQPASWATRYYSDTQEVIEDTVQSWADNLYTRILGGCMTCSNTYIMVNQVNALYVEMLYNRYDGTPTSVNPECPTDNFNGNGSTARESALCMGLDAWTKSYIEAWVKQAALVLGLVAIGGWLFAVPVLGWVAYIIAGGAAFFALSYYNALTDEDVVFNVLCCWLDNLYDVAISRANWQAQLEACDFESGSDEYKVWQVLCSEVTTDKQWCAFLDALGNAYPLAELGVQDCPCEECEDWTYKIDFRAGNQSFSASPANRATHTANQGWGHGTALNYVVQIQSPTYSSFVMKGITLEISIPAVGRKLCQYRIPDVNGTVYDGTFVGNELTHTIMLPTQRETIKFWIGVDCYSTHWDGYIRSVTVFGCGYNPFI